MRLAAPLAIAVGLAGGCSEPARPAPALRAELAIHVPRVTAVEAAQVRDLPSLRAELAREQGLLEGLLTDLSNHSAPEAMLDRVRTAAGQLDEALGQIEGYEANAGAKSRRFLARRALLNLKSAPLSLSLLVLDVPMAARENRLSADVARQIEARARALRVSVEALGRASEDVLRPMAES